MVNGKFIKKVLNTAEDNSDEGFLENMVETEYQEKNSIYFLPSFKLKDTKNRKFSLDSYTYNENNVIPEENSYNSISLTNFYTI